MRLLAWFGVTEPVARDVTRADETDVLCGVSTDPTPENDIRQIHAQFAFTELFTVAVCPDPTVGFKQ